MKVQRHFVYTQTRMQARHGMRPDARSWEQLESQNELASYLHFARQTGLRPWVITLHAHDPHHLLESTLLRFYRNYIEEVAHWQPHPWQPAVQWVKVLMDLPVLQHLLAGNTARSWMTDDANLKALTVTTTEQRLQAMQDSPYAPLLHGWETEQNLLQSWLQHWQQLWPEQTRTITAGLLKLIEVLQEHTEQFSNIETAQAWPLREQLSKQLNTLFRRYSYQPATAFIHLSLVALDMERLRGGIVQRRLFPPLGRAEKKSSTTTSVSSTTTHEALV